MCMPILKRVNQEFFKIWSPKMAYVLGFFAADGSMYRSRRSGYYLSFYSNDREIIEKIKLVMGAEHKIGERKIDRSSSHKRYTLQIGSKKLYGQLLELGMCEAKSKVLQFPKVPDEFLAHFVRGYFDGDGNITAKEYSRLNRKNCHYYFAVKFISGSLPFLRALRIRIREEAGVGEGSLFNGTRSFVLSYAKKDSKSLCVFMYSGVDEGLYLKRKYLVYTEAKKIMER
jgi:intein/homing endonuclease